MAHSAGFKRLQKLFAVASWARINDVPVAEAESKFDAMLLDRRAVLQGMAASAAMLTMPLLTAACGDSTSSSTTKRVAVIGAGIAGLHCAWRLKEAGADVVLFDAQNRVGGRMWTARDVLPGNLQFEIGGELIDSNHATMFALAEEFNIELDDRWAAEKTGMIRETWYVNGARVAGETLLEQTIAVSAKMTADVEAAETDDTAFETLDNTSMKDWLATNVPPATYPELHAVLTVAFIGEYGLEAEEQSILNLLYLFGFGSEEEFLIFGDSDERWHTHGGNDLFCTKLAEAIGSANIRLQSKLTKAAGPTNGPYTLTFENLVDNSTFEEEVLHIVFALPFTLLRKIDLTGLTLSDDKRTVISELAYGTNAKVMGHFSSRPWWDVHNESGLLTTDLSAQQGWDSTIGQEGVTGGVWTNFVGGQQGVDSKNGTPAEYFNTVLGDLETIWPGSEAAFTGTAERMHWPTFEWAQGSYTCYRPGQWAFWSTEGTREGNVHFCGEHCSLDFQGWMEGAAETGGLAAAEVLESLGISATRTMQLALASKLTRPQAAFRSSGRLRWMRRAKRLSLR